MNNEQLMWLLGLYISNTYYTKYMIIISKLELYKGTDVHKKTTHYF